MVSTRAPLTAWLARSYPPVRTNIGADADIALPEPALTRTTLQACFDRTRLWERPYVSRRWACAPPRPKGA